MEQQDLPSRVKLRAAQSALPSDGARSARRTVVCMDRWRGAAKAAALGALALVTVVLPLTGAIQPDSARASVSDFDLSSLSHSNIQSGDADDLRSHPGAAARAAIRSQLGPEQRCLAVGSSANGVRTALVKPESLTVQSLIWPLNQNQYHLSSGFGMRLNPVLGTYMLHAGVDMAGSIGSPIMSVADGKVLRVGWDSGLGYSVEIYHPKLNFTTVYGHMVSGSSPLKVGQTVRLGQMIGHLGSTGNSTGPHLHFEVHPGGRDSNPGSAVEPLSWMKSHGVEYRMDALAACQ